MRTKKKYGGNKLNSLPKPKLGHPWEVIHCHVWYISTITQSCNRITQSNYLSSNNLGMGPGLPIATNTLHGKKKIKQNLVRPNV